MCWLLTKKDSTSRLARWSLWCQEHNLKIVHKSGKLNTDVDALSRHPIGEEPKEKEEFENFMIFLLQTKENSSEALKGAQRKFAKWSKIFEQLESGKLQELIFNSSMAHFLPCPHVQLKPTHDFAFHLGNSDERYFKQIMTYRSPDNVAFNELGANPTTLLLARNDRNDPEICSFLQRLSNTKGRLRKTCRLHGTELPYHRSCGLFYEMR